MASPLEQHFGGKGCSGMLSQEVSYRAVLSGRASSKDNLFERRALPVFIIQGRHPDIAGALAWAWTITLSARLSISPQLGFTNVVVSFQRI